jgi:sn-glycerol 3-phosphate transport system substrate-binding protein
MGRRVSTIAVVALCLIPLLSSCDAVRTGNASPTATGEPPACVTDPGRAPGAPLVVWHNFESLYLSAFVALVNDFEVATGQKVELVGFSSTDAILEAYRTTPEQQRPDLLTGSELSVVALGDSGQFVPASACAEDVGSSLAAELVPDIAATWSTGGRWWAVPFAVSVPVLFIRAAALDAAGAPAPSTPDELAELAQGLVAAGYTTTPLGFDDGLPPVLIEQWSARVGEPLTVTDDDAVDARLDNTAAVDALSWFDVLVADGLAVPVRGGQAAFYKAFVADIDPLPMVIVSSAAVGAARVVAPAGIPSEGPPVVVGLPVPGEGALPGGSAWWLPVRPMGDPPAAYAFASWLAAPRQQAAFTTRTGFVPVTMRTLDEPVLIEAWNNFPSLSVGWDLLARPLSVAAQSGVHVGPRAELRRILTSAFERSRAGQPVLDALATADAEFQGLLDVYDRTVTRPSG